MKLKEDDKQLLNELCKSHQISYEKMLKLIETTQEFEFKERRAGIYDALSQVIKSDYSNYQAS